MGGNEPQPGTSAGPGTNDKILFWASFFTLIAAGIGFSVRGFVIKDWGNQFGFTQAELGGISGGGLIGFGVAIIFFSFFADLFGYGKLMLVAFLLHASSAVVTFAATPIYAAYGKEGAFACLNLGMWLFALGNGTCEAVINPLTATLFPKNKTHWLNILHAGWPLGLILGALVGVVLKQVDVPIRWEFKLGVFLLPVLLYGLLMFNRPFPKSEAKSAGIALPEMMGAVGLFGFAVAAIFLGLAVPTLLAAIGITAPPLVGYAFGGIIWVAYALYSNFAPGSILIAFIYLLHALVGYVELGTDNWITNISNQVLKDETTALLAFIWTNALMCFLRFFAGPIVHKINPIGLLLVSAILGTIGLYLLGQPSTNTVALWVGAVTIYGLGKTFYWPTLLGVISERFPKGGALAIGISGGVGMLCAGLIGSPGIGYKQDFAAVQKVKELSNDTYLRYAARDDKGELKPVGYPIISQISPELAPPVAGLDNGKLKVFDDFLGNVKTVFKAQKANQPEKIPFILDTEEGERKVKIKIDGNEELVAVRLTTAEKYEALVEKAKADKKDPPPLLQTTLDGDVATMKKELAASKPVGEKLQESLNGLKAWWDKDGKPNVEKDDGPLEEARDTGARKALYWTAAVPAALAVGFLLLLLYFASTGGYKQVHLDQRGHTVETVDN